MKAVMVLIGVLATGAACAQVRTVQPQSPVTPQMAKVLNAPDMQLSVLRQQLTLLEQKQAQQQEQIASLQEKNAHLEYCLGQLKKEIKDPNNYDSAVIVQNASPLTAKPCP